jgi:hypothetical protein
MTKPASWGRQLADCMSDRTAGSLNLPMAKALWGSHILRFAGECEAFSYCCEALPTVAHGFGAWGL